MDSVPCVHHLGIKVRRGRLLCDLARFVSVPGAVFDFLLQATEAFFNIIPPQIGIGIHRQLIEGTARKLLLSSTAGGRPFGSAQGNAVSAFPAPFKKVFLSPLIPIQYIAGRDLLQRTMRYSSARLASFSPVTLPGVCSLRIAPSMSISLEFSCSAWATVSVRFSVPSRLSNTLPKR